MGRHIYDLGNRQWGILKLRELLENILPHNHSFEGYLVEHDFPSIGQHKILLNTRCIVGSTGYTQMILMTIEEAP